MYCVLLLFICCSVVSTMNRSRLVCGTLNHLLLHLSHHKCVYMTSHDPSIPGGELPQNNMPVAMATVY